MINRNHPLDSWSQEYVDSMRQQLGDAACSQLDIFALPDPFVLSVVVPVYNESGTVENVVKSLIATGLPLQIILVDDGSLDGSAEQLELLLESQKLQSDGRSGRNNQVNIQVFKHPQNRGKGAAIRTGVEAATGDIIVIQDADLEYDPMDFRKLLRPLVAGHADVAYGTRYGSADRHVSPWWHQAINQIITLLASVAIGPRLTDVETCYKMALREHFQTAAAACHENRFGIEIELTARFARRKLRFVEKPIQYRHRWYSEGKKIGWKDGVSALRCIVWYGLFRQ